MLFLGMVLFLIACNGGKKSVEQNTPIDTETLIQMNQDLLSKDMTANIDYARAKQWNYIKLENGVIYEIIEHGKGAKAKSKDVVSFSFEMFNLKEEMIYSSDKKGPKTFVIDYNEIEAGLNDIAKVLNEGDSLRMILPPHMAFGVPGDGNKIPARTSLVYYLKLLSIQEQN